MLILLRKIELLRHNRFILTRESSRNGQNLNLQNGPVNRIIKVKGCGYQNPRKIFAGIFLLKA